MKFDNSPPLVKVFRREQQRVLRHLDKRILQTVDDFLRQRKPSIEGAQAAWEPQLAKEELHDWAPTAGIEAAYRFESDAGTLSIGGSLTLVAGRIGRAASFDGKVFSMLERLRVSKSNTSSLWPPGCALIQLRMAVVTRIVDNPKGKGYGSSRSRQGAALTLGMERRQTPFPLDSSMELIDMLRLRYWELGSRLDRLSNEDVSRGAA